jgi:tetratricopeptide (TPR) repeat protein
MQTAAGGGLGAQLDELDVLISRIGSKNSQQAFQILQKMDAIDALISRLEDQGANVKAEAGQYESASAVLQKQAAALVRDAGGASAFQSEREKRNPPESAWWWRLDEIAAQKKKDSLLRAAKWGAALAILASLLVAAYLIFLAPSPEAMARYQAIDRTTTLAQSGNYSEAMGAIQKGLDVLPDDPDLLLWQGIILSLQGKDQQAAVVFSVAQGKAADAEDFYLKRCQDYLSIGQDSLAEQDAQAAIQANSISAMGYYLLASAQDEAGDKETALKNYQTASTLAEQQNDSALIVESRMKMGYIIQGAGAGYPGIPTPTPTGGAGTP